MGIKRIYLLLILLKYYVLPSRTNLVLISQCLFLILEGVHLN